MVHTWGTFLLEKGSAMHSGELVGTADETQMGGGEFGEGDPADATPTTNTRRACRVGQTE